MKLSTLQALVTIETHGSIRAAAQQMHLTQPALTAAIQQIEEELQAPLLVRSKQGVTFTRFGQALLKHAKLMVTQSQRATEEVAQMRGCGKARSNWPPRPPLAWGCFRRHCGNSSSSTRKWWCIVVMAFIPALPLCCAMALWTLP